MHPILVTGATGGHGNTGEHLVRRLTAAGHPVRVLSRRPNARTRRMTELGAELAVGDLHDRRTLVPALQGVDLAYFVYPIDDGICSAAANFAAAAREAGRYPRTVVMSMGPANPEHPSALGRAQWLAEQLLGWAGLNLTILRVAALFHENIVALHAQSIRHDNTIRNCFGQGAVPWISGRDAADLAATALLNPEVFGSDPVQYVSGSEDVGHAEIAQLLTDLLDRPIDFESVGMEQWREELVDLSDMDDTGTVNPAMAQHISAVAARIAQNAPTTTADPDRLEHLIGRPCTRLHAFLSANRDAFGTPL
ncbi:NAD(P)H-binding protein [Mycobacterium yunnanensis]|uniref:NAD(P)H-binding protein n=1 Tax=Mycobacterium yunnanensis TaxID=368477 RepID=A0A9X3C258_9MYCO|nr:NAD(P)H-binding protein [Mycobacterium yunnanensis]